MSAWTRDRGSSNAQLGVYVLTAMKRLTNSHIVRPQDVSSTTGIPVILTFQVLNVFYGSHAYIKTL